MDTRNQNYTTAICFILTTGMLNACSGGDSGGASGDGSDSMPMRSWGVAELIETDNVADARFPQITVNTTGNAIAVWSQNDGIQEHIWAKRYIAGNGWINIELINTDDRRYKAVTPQVAIDASGNAVAVWRQNDGTRYSIWSNRFTPERGWRIPELIETNDNPASSPQIAMNTNGDALVIWPQGDNVWTNRYTTSNGWGTAEIIGTKTSAPHPRIATDAAGNAIAVWVYFDGTNYNILANRYTNGIGWGKAELIEGNPGFASIPEIACDANGNAFAIWSQDDNIYTNHYTTGIGWNIATLIGNDDNNSNNPQITIDANGNAIAVWQHNDGTFDNMWANRYTTDSGWGIAELIETNDGSNLNPKIAIDVSGNVIAVWRNEDGTGNLANIMANQYTSSNGWGKAQVIEISNEGYSHDASIAIDAFGDAIAVWTHYDGIRNNIWTNRFE